MIGQIMWGCQGVSSHMVPQPYVYPRTSVIAPLTITAANHRDSKRLVACQQRRARICDSEVDCTAKTQLPAFCIATDGKCLN